jgi:bacteriorhodopsin
MKMCYLWPYQIIIFPMIRFIHVSEKNSVLKSFFLISLFSFLSYTSLNAQNYLTVPFTNGFVGDNTCLLYTSDAADE